ncbi:nuclear transport factor 2 family protein [Novosphingobium lentum]|uniref:nuclear transport factor 2 family protein n=1 Tax=Novosphingobium lentum TaxID=145287 RepID=UPI00082D1E7F|nr:nuclear transport factor 2 family protein [Novosphingobium lentum]
MRKTLAVAMLLATMAGSPAQAATCKLTPKQVVTRFTDQFYVRKDVRPAFERWVDPGYIQHNPMAATGRDAAVAFLAPFLANPEVRYEVKRVIADGPLVAVHSHGTFKAGDPGIAVVDIFRVRGCRIMEHWDVVQPVPAQSANTNTMF